MRVHERVTYGSGGSCLSGSCSSGNAIRCSVPKQGVLSVQDAFTPEQRIFGATEEGKQMFKRLDEKNKRVFEEQARLKLAFCLAAF